MREAPAGRLKEGVEIVSEEFPADRVALVMNGGSDEAADVAEPG